MLASYNLAAMRLLGRAARSELAMQVRRASLAARARTTHRALSSDKAAPAPASASIGAGTFESLGLSKALVEALRAGHEPPIIAPTSVQQAVLPRLLQGENLVIAGSTGSGKTLAFTLPVLQSLAAEEAAGYMRQPLRPRALILVPTRELARQVLSTVKALSHTSKVSSCAVLGGEQYGLQKRSLNRVVDVVVASPGRLMQHKEQGNVFFSHVRHVVIDEVDTMLMQGFGPDIRAVLKGVLNRPTPPPAAGASASSAVQESTPAATPAPAPVQLVMATATLTKAVRALLSDAQGGFQLTLDALQEQAPAPLSGGVIGSSRSHRSSSTAGTAGKGYLSRSEREATSVSLAVVEVDGLHKAHTNVAHSVVNTKGEDKLLLLKRILGQSDRCHLRTMIFCNSMASVRAVQHGLREGGISAASYHGELNSRERAANVAKFRTGEEQFLVCTDLAARGLDIPDIDHVLLFDFPLNPIDYLHRSGRCGRAGKSGLVTSLVQKRDVVLAEAIQQAIRLGQPLDSLSANKKDYLTPAPAQRRFTGISGSSSSSARAGKTAKASVKVSLSGGMTDFGYSKRSRRSKAFSGPKPSYHAGKGKMGARKGGRRSAGAGAGAGASGEGARTGRVNYKGSAR